MCEVCVCVCVCDVCVCEVCVCVFIEPCSLHIRLLRRDPTIQVWTGGHSVY